MMMKEEEEEEEERERERERGFDALMVYCLWLKIALSTRGGKK